MKIGLCTIAYRDKLLDVALDAGARLGFDGVEIWGREPHLSETFDENRVRAAAAMAKARGLEIPVLGSYTRAAATRQRSGENVGLEATLHIARRLKTPIVRVWASDVASADASEALWRRSADELKRACEMAAELGISLAAEMHSGTLCDTGASAARLVALVDRPGFGLNFQVALPGSAEPLSERLDRTLAHVVHVHAQNYAPQGGRQHPTQAVIQAPLSRGIWDNAALVERLREAGYDGYIMVEFPYADGEQREAALADDLAYLRSLTGG